MAAPVADDYEVTTEDPAARLYALGYHSSRMPTVRIPRKELKHAVGSARPNVVWKEDLPEKWNGLGIMNRGALRESWYAYPPPPFPITTRGRGKGHHCAQ
jgi:hypothetical protein